MSPSAVYKPPVPEKKNPETPTPVIPPPIPTEVPVSPAPVIQSNPPTIQPQQSPSSNKKNTPQTILLIAAGLFLSAVVMAAGFAFGYFLVSTILASSTDQPSVNTGNRPETVYKNFTLVKENTIKVDGKLHTDDKGVGLQVNPMEGKANAPLSLTASKPDKNFTRAFDDQYSVESLAYNLSAKGAADTARQGTLVFPAKSPDDRLAVVIDNQFVGILSITPQDGKLTINSRVDLPGGDPAYSPKDTITVPTKYMVVRPKKSNLLPSQTSQQITTRGGGLQSPDHEETLESCGTWYHNYCWKNKEASIMIFFDKKTNLSYPFIDLITTSKTALDKYLKLGFTGANYSKDNPLYIVVGGKEAPYYSSITGNIYVPVDTLENSNDPQTRYMLSHELFHWTEDETYAMTTDGMSGSTFWWLEVAAENAAYQVDPQFINNNLEKYGRTETQGKLGFLLEPFNWVKGEEARYVHGQSLYVGLCNGGQGCSINQEEFVFYINKAGNPFEAASAKERFMANADDVARYLIGIPPQNSRTDAEIPKAVKSGKLYGDFIHGKQKGDGIEFQLSKSGPNMARSEQGVIITQTIPAGNVYPLRVSNGANGPDETGTPLKSGPPIYLLIDAGQNYWVKAGNNAPFDGSGKGQLMLGPIHDKFGLDSVRVNAYAKSKSSEFHAAVGIVDLSGDWFGQDVEIVGQENSCPDTSVDEDSKYRDSDPFLDILSAYGTFIKNKDDPSGRTLEWEQDKPIPDFTGTILAKAIVGADDIRVSYLIDIPKETSSLFERQFVNHSPKNNRENPIPAWGFAIIPGLSLASYPFWKNRRKGYSLFVICLILVLLVTSSGCGLKNMYGKIEGLYIFTRMEYPEKDFSYPTNGDTYWLLSEGTGTVKMDIFSISYVNLFDKSKGTTEQECVTTLRYKMNGAVQKDGIFTPADLDLGGSNSE